MQFVNLGSIHCLVLGGVMIFREGKIFSVSSWEVHICYQLIGPVVILFTIMVEGMYR